MKAIRNIPTGLFNIPLKFRFLVCFFLIFFFFIGLHFYLAMGGLETHAATVTMAYMDIDINYVCHGGYVLVQVVSLFGCLF